MKVALIHDWLTGMRGGESCLEILCEIYPQADIFTILHNKGSVSPCIEEKTIKSSFIQKLPFLNKYRHYLPLFPTAIESFNLNGYDLVISVNHCVAKGVVTAPETMHICYCLTPMRYVWDMYFDYFPEDGKGIANKFIIPLFANYLRMWDFASSKRVEHYISISNYIAGRVLKYYGRESEVVYPPVNCEKFMVSEQIGDYYLMVSAFAPYKRVDLAVQAFNRLGLPLIIIGKGQDEKKLKSMASNNIKFLGWASNETIQRYYSQCKALVFPGKEDFGIVPLEAQASGRPVIAFGQGGACETVVPANPKGNVEGGQAAATGLFFYEQTVDAMEKAVKEFEKIIGNFDAESVRKHALKFDRAVFKEKLKESIEKKYREFSG